MKISTPLLDWYHQHRRVLPFREDPTPYHIWVSEIMLQQTRVAAALPYYHRFMQALPDVADLARCEDEKLLKLWEGLGYYSRARNLKKAAIVLVEQYNGQLPGDYDDLLSLPGIGEYTAGAIASIAFGLPEVAVDGNVLRVFSRLLACGDDITKPVTKKSLTAEVRCQQPKDMPGDYNQALMELGALVCTPKTPLCASCPLQSQCTGYQQGVQNDLPRRAPKPQKPILPFTGLVVLCGHDVLLQQRPAKGLLSGMWQPPLFEGHLTKSAAGKKLAEIVPGAQVQRPLPDARHIFTHKIWQMTGWLCSAPTGSMPTKTDCLFVTQNQLNESYAVPSAFRTWLPFMCADGEN